MFQLGIRKKITYGFYLLLIIMVGSAILTFTIVKRVERQVTFGEVVEDFFNTTLEVRRFEKNYFLYRQEKDFQENQSYRLKIQEIFNINSDALEEVVFSTDIQHLAYVIASYNDNMERFHEYAQKLGQKDENGTTIRPQRLEHLEEQIRATGKELTEFGEKTSDTVKQKIKLLLKTTKHILLISMLCLFVAALAIAAFLGRRVVNSLKMLEGYTKIISQGDFVEISVGEGEQEIRSLLTAFNRMTKELQIRQHQLVQSEKLAALGTLLSGVAHELNNPLYGIMNTLELLKTEVPEGNRRRKLLDMSLSEIVRLADMLKKML
ncbi:MAG: histidine kinase dimerization/phospho-acceptor domain-containing protein, partial [Desulfocapsaceae bacterium]|nr:histidine kinase dimerization/phospho-acceptor domain-containing protein [Desulfocapsaceae bacterium]